VHPKNPHLDGYDMQALVKASPALKSFLIKSKHGRDSINFSDERAVKELNKALLFNHYGLNYWDIPKGHLCPPIPGRVDYLLGIHDALSKHSLLSKVPSNEIKALDIGTGANLIYPIAGSGLFEWQWVGSDIDSQSLKNSQGIVDNNTKLRGRIELRLQNNPEHMFKGIIEKGEYFHITCCNPPFHKSAEEAMAGSVRKNKNLARNKNKRMSNVKSIQSNQHLNFEGKSNELWCEGGELAFVKKMINESRAISDQVGLFTCLISKKDNIPNLLATLKASKVREFDVHEMEQGNKISRFISWQF
jgi:23S rRNA (adenine1618-N6)-methyltransferase